MGIPSDVGVQEVKSQTRLLYLLAPSLTPADSVGAADVIAIIALESLVVVTRLALVAILVQLGSTHLTAPATVAYRTHSWGAGGTIDGALADFGASGFGLWRKGQEKVEKCSQLDTFEWF